VSLRLRKCWVAWQRRSLCFRSAASWQAWPAWYRPMGLLISAGHSPATLATVHALVPAPWTLMRSKRLRTYADVKALSRPADGLPAAGPTAGPPMKLIQPRWRRSFPLVGHLLIMSVVCLLCRGAVLLVPLHAGGRPGGGPSACGTS